MTKDWSNSNYVQLKQSLPHTQLHKRLLPVHTTVFPESVCSEPSSQLMETFLLLTFADNSPEFSCGFSKIACMVSFGSRLERGMALKGPEVLVK